MARIPTNDRLLELDDGRSVGYATWGDRGGRPVFIGHGTPESRLDRYAAIDDPEWIRSRRVRFVGVDRPGGMATQTLGRKRASSTAPGTSCALPTT